ncbi:MAG: Transcriptional regulator, TrmB [Parcubacteria group bacterium GW2011_GWA2_31_28]|nr:MAG: Transcriptional regulator, TrmB [Parcubacteria group bacterium GW2011_GWA2_31_28]
MYNDLFRLLGLSEKESEIYLLLLKEGPLNISQISKDARINRTFCYDLVGNMLNKGAIIKKGGSKGVFEAMMPKQLKINVEKSYLNALDEVEELEKLKGYEKEGDFEVLTFDGYYPTMNLIKLLLSQDQTIHSFWSKKVGKLFQLFFEENLKVRVNKKIYNKVITEDDPRIREWIKGLTFKETYREVKYVKGLSLDATTYIFGNSVAILTFKKGRPQGILIRNADYANTQKKIFDTFWNNIKN